MRLFAFYTVNFILISLCNFHGAFHLNMSFYHWLSLIMIQNLSEIFQYKLLMCYLILASHALCQIFFCCFF